MVNETLLEPFSKDDLQVTAGAFAAFERDKSLMMYLQQIQGHFGYIPPPTIRYIAERTLFSESHIFGIITFYSQFRTKPVGKYIIKICSGTACHVAGSQSLARKLKEFLAVSETQPTTEDGLFTLQSVACLGCCALSPAMMIEDEVYGKLDDSRIKKIINEYRRQEKP